MTGTKLGHYEITTHLGSGGMGDVYQATDSKLGRSVAIKFLPEAFGHDTERVARFQREARVLAALNHSNIAAIHGLEEIDNRHFLVMELVSGETLTDRIKRGAIPIEEALPIAKQIAEALEEAHEKGIIHRDLKPANIKLTADGKVKVLDFGLAKAYEREASPSVSNSPTISMAATNAGLILGTAAYMSPEQARGKAVDRRTDVWALGCVLYEMLTGKAAFGGEDVTEILASVVKSEPDWSLLPATTPAPIRTLLRRCLEKDRKRRLDSAAAARLEIEDVLTTPLAIAAETSTRSDRTRLAWVVAAVAVVLAVGLATPAIKYLSETPAAETRVDIVTPATSDPVSIALSPDGRQVMFVASSERVSRLWLRSLTSTAAQPLAGTEGAFFPFWSPDSRSIGFFADGQLKRLDIGGGAPRSLAATPTPRGGTWNAEDVILFAPRNNAGLFRIGATGGTPVPVTKLVGQISHQIPVFLPDGRHFLFYANGQEEGIYLGSLDGPGGTRLTTNNSAGTYLPFGWLLWVSNRMLVAQRLDLGQRALTGEPVTLADGVGIDGLRHLGAVSVSAATGLIAYRTRGESHRQLTWLDRAGKVLGTLGEQDVLSPSISPDGRRVAVVRIVQGNYDLWLMDGVRMSRFTFTPSTDQFPIWSPDGRQIAFNSDQKGPRNLYVKIANGAAAEELLVESPLTKAPTDWSRDGRFILYQTIDPQTFSDLWVRPMESGGQPWVFLKTPFDERRARFSPDGHWVAYQSNESGRYEIYVRPFMPPAAGSSVNATAGQWQVSTDGGIQPTWGADGRELYYVGPNGEMMATPITVQEAIFKPGTPVALFQTRIVGGGNDDGQSPSYDVTRDGRFLINTVLDDIVDSPITLLQNWRPPTK
jgi:eukaryotic-like serine/threonine-protein kinase